jgi:hypothetical protein
VFIIIPYLDAGGSHCVLFRCQEWARLQTSYTARRGIYALSADTVHTFICYASCRVLGVYSVLSRFTRFDIIRDFQNATATYFKSHLYIYANNLLLSVPTELGDDLTKKNVTLLLTQILSYTSRDLTREDIEVCIIFPDITRRSNYENYKFITTLTLS